MSYRLAPGVIKSILNVRNNTGIQSEIKVVGKRFLQGINKLGVYFGTTELHVILSTKTKKNTPTCSPDITAFLKQFNRCTLHHQPFAK